MRPRWISFLEAFGKIHAECIFVFPNNGNIFMAASQAAKFYTDAKVVVIPSKDVGTGYVALTAADLARAMEGGWFSAEAEAARLARLARLQLAVTCGSAALSSLAGLLCLGRASFALTWDLPLTELLAALACALLARFVAEGARVKRENDEFV